MRWSVRCAVWVALFATVLGCHRAPPASVARPVTQIAWFKGSVEQAFALAQQTHKPLLLYWGAAWCPYCQALRKSVFTRADFIDKSSLFVPVYLDGDAPGAGFWGQTFKISGYPTLIILSPQRAELARMSGGMDLSQYATLLDDALQDQRPIQEVLHSVHSNEDCHRLAYTFWDPQAVEGNVDDATLAALLSQAATQCHGIEQSRLTVSALNFALQAKTDPRLLQARVQGLYEMLSHRQDMRAAMDVIASLDDSLFALVRQQGSAFAQDFRKRWVAFMQSGADDTHFGDADRLIALGSALDATKALSADHAIPAPMQEDARSRIQAAMDADRDRFKRDDLVNAAAIVYDVLGDHSAAQAMYLKELPNTRTPYYYMSHLAALAEQQGRAQEALEWMTKAYALAQGQATRLRWGSSLLRGLIRLAPQDTTRIRGAAQQVAADVTGGEHPQGRSQAEMTRISTALTQWATTPERRAVAEEFDARLTQAAPATRG